MKATSRQWQRYLFIAVWIIASVFLGWQLRRPPYSFDAPQGVPSLVLVFLCTIALMIWIRNPIQNEPTEQPARKGWLLLYIWLSVGLLWAARGFIGEPLMFGLPVIAILILVLLKRPLEKREVFYALALALVAGVTGLSAGWITFIGPVTWGLLQVFLVLTGLLAGWSILRSAGLLQQGVGTSRFLSGGAGPAFKSFGTGMLIAVPWAFLIVLMGGGSRETWVKSWWQPVIALQAGIAEEAWGRILLVPLLFLLFRRVSQPRTAFTVALFIAAFWFANLHVAPADMVSTVLIGTLYALPAAYLCLYRDLETAIGWHFWVDFVKFAVAFILLPK